MFLPELKNKVAIVTGASTGIGRATSILFSAHGARVVLVSRSHDKLKEVGNTIRGMGNLCIAVTTDVRDPTQVDSMARKALQEYGAIDILVNNAGVGIWGPLAESSMSDWDYIINTNLKGTFLCTRSVVPIMASQNRGFIINVASQAGKRGMPNLAIYCASKFGIIGLSESLKKELCPHGIRVFYICPGYVNTDFFTNSNFVKPSNIRRMVEPEDVARDILMLIRGNTQKRASEQKLSTITSRAVLRIINKYAAKLNQILDEKSKP